jgi:hypothetical protein
MSANNIANQPTVSSLEHLLRGDEASIAAVRATAAGNAWMHEIAPRYIILCGRTNVPDIYYRPCDHLKIVEQLGAEGWKRDGDDAVRSVGRVRVRLDAFFEDRVRDKGPVLPEEMRKRIAA